MSELSPDALRIIEKTRHQGGPRPGDKARIRAAIDAAIVPDVGLRAAEEASKEVVKRSLVKWGAVGAVLASLIVGVVFYEGSSSISELPPAEESATAQDTPILDRELEHAEKLVRELDERPQKNGLEALTKEDESKSQRSRNLRNKKLKRTKAPSLEAELRIVRSAQQERKSGNYKKALALLEKHRVQFPKGMLSAEREAARVLTLCDANERKKAMRVAGRFLSRYPKSPLGHSVQQSCAFNGAKKNDDSATD